MTTQEIIDSILPKHPMGAFGMFTEMVNMISDPEYQENWKKECEKNDIKHRSHWN